MDSTVVVLKVAVKVYRRKWILRICRWWISCSTIPVSTSAASCQRFELNCRRYVVIWLWRLGQSSLQFSGTLMLCITVEELLSIRASLLSAWWNHSIFTVGHSRCRARAKPRPPLLLSIVATLVCEFLSIFATSCSVISIGSLEYMQSVMYIIPSLSTA